MASLVRRGLLANKQRSPLDPAAEQVALPSNGSVVEAVRDGRVDLGVAPIENSLEGAVNETLDALLRAEAVSIQAELVVPVEHNLIAATNVRMEDVQVVMSHPQALAQCRAFLESRLPNARLEAALSTFSRGRSSSSSFWSGSRGNAPGRGIERRRTPGRQHTGRPAKQDPFRGRRSRGCAAVGR